MHKVSEGAEEAADPPAFRIVLLQWLKKAMLNNIT